MAPNGGSSNTQLGFDLFPRQGRLLRSILHVLEIGSILERADENLQKIVGELFSALFEALGESA